MKPETAESDFAKWTQELLGSKILEMTDYLGDLCIYINKQDIHSVCQALRDDPKIHLNQMMDLTAVDYLKQNRTPRFEVVYHLFSLSKKHRLRIKCKLTEQDLSIDSIHDLWLCANWYERECFDMYGIKFISHPDLRRILMYDGFEGHPLRKDYPITKEQPRMQLREVEERYEYMNKDPKSWDTTLKEKE